MSLCPGCKSTSVRCVAVGKRQRIECAGCGRFAGYASNEVSPAKPEPAEVAPLASVQRPNVELPAAWLYVSKRLDIEWLPNVPLWAAPVITFGEAAYYRLTANVLAWLEAAGESLCTQVAAGNLERDQLSTYLDAMDVVFAFAYDHIPSAEIIAARSQSPSLPTFTQTAM